MCEICAKYKNIHISFISACDDDSCHNDFAKIEVYLFYISFMISKYKITGMFV